MGVKLIIPTADFSAVAVEREPVCITDMDMSNTALALWTDRFAIKNPTAKGYKYYKIRPRCYDYQEVTIKGVILGNVINDFTFCYAVDNQTVLSKDKDSADEEIQVKANPGKWTYVRFSKPVTLNKDDKVLFVGGKNLTSDNAPCYLSPKSNPQKEDANNGVGIYGTGNNNVGGSVSIPDFSTDTAILCGLFI